MIEQVTVFIENKPGHLEDLCKLLGNNGISMRALMIADTTEFGVVRIVCDKPQVAIDVLRNEKYSAALTKVIAAEVPDTPGGLASVLGIINKYNANIEYAYCFLNPTTGTAIDILKISGEGSEKAMQGLKEAGVKLLDQEEIEA